MPLDPSVRSLIATFRRSPNWDSDLDFALLKKLWPTLIGERLAQSAKVVAIQGSTLVINVPDRVWRKQLLSMKSALLERINEPWSSARLTNIAITHEDH